MTTQASTQEGGWGLADREEDEKEMAAMARACDELAQAGVFVRRDDGGYELAPNHESALRAYWLSREGRESQSLVESAEDD